jgi:ATP-dependent helicase HepA
LLREDVQFLTWDHPLVTGALDLLLGSERGNSSFIEAESGQTPLLEAVYVVECVAPPELHVDRFLPPTPVRTVVEGGQNEGVDQMLARALPLAHNQVPQLVAQAKKEMAAQLDGEISRLVELKKVNPGVRDDEIEMLVQQRAELETRLGSARLRLDAVRWTSNSGH